VENRITNSSPDTEERCREAQATTAFIWINFILFAVTTAFLVRRVHFHRRSGAKNSTTMAHDTEYQPEIAGGMVADDPLPKTGLRLPKLFKFGGRRSRDSWDVNNNNVMSEVPRQGSVREDETVMDDYSIRS
jgi:hypothetical protein